MRQASWGALRGDPHQGERPKSDQGQLITATLGDSRKDDGHHNTAPLKSHPTTAWLPKAANMERFSVRETHCVGPSQVKVIRHIFRSDKPHAPFKNFTSFRSSDDGTLFLLVLFDLKAEDVGFDDGERGEALRCHLMAAHFLECLAIEVVIEVNQSTRSGENPIIILGWLNGVLQNLDRLCFHKLQSVCTSIHDRTGLPLPADGVAAYCWKRLRLTGVVKLLSTKKDNFGGIQVARITFASTKPVPAPGACNWRGATGGQTVHRRHGCTGRCQCLHLGRVRAHGARGSDIAWQRRP